MLGAGSGTEQAGNTLAMLLRATGLVVRHHPSLPPALAGVDLELAAGEVVGIVGANGSGKSTLARALVGLLPLDAGAVVGADGRHAPRVGLVLQDPAAQLIAVTVADELALGPEASGLAPEQVTQLVARHLQLGELQPLQARDPATLSGGQQQRVAIAAIEACDVEVLVLDEPTAMLDPRARSRFAQRVREAAAGRAVAWITQEPDDLEWCDRVFVLDAGVVTWTGSLDAYIAQPHVAASFGLELPVAARIAHAMRTREAWPEQLRIPRTEADLLQWLAGVVDA
jgi:energy-coupling factor transporter ATP-binding protein EcfA2